MTSKTWETAEEIQARTGAEVEAVIHAVMSEFRIGKAVMGCDERDGRKVAVFKSK